MILIDIEPYKDCYIGKDILVNFSDGPLVGMSGEVFAKVTSIKDIPVVRVRVQEQKAHWNTHKWKNKTDYECSNCHVHKKETSDYCPDCGAKFYFEPGETIYHSIKNKQKQVF